MPKKKPTKEKEERQVEVPVAHDWKELRRRAQQLYVQFVAKDLEVPERVLAKLRRDVRSLRRFKMEPDLVDGKQYNQFTTFRRVGGGRAIGIEKPDTFRGKSVSVEIFRLLFDDAHAATAQNVKFLQDALGVKLYGYHVRAFAWLWEQCRARVRDTSPEFVCAFRGLEQFLLEMGAGDARDDVWLDREVQLEKSWVPGMLQKFGNGPTSRMVRNDYRGLRKQAIGSFRAFRKAETADEAYVAACAVLEDQASLNELRRHYPEAKRGESRPPDFILNTSRVEGLARMRLAKEMSEAIEDGGADRVNNSERALYHELEAEKIFTS